MRGRELPSRSGDAIATFLSAPATDFRAAATGVLIFELLALCCARIADPLAELHEFVDMIRVPSDRRHHRQADVLAFHTRLRSIELHTWRTLQRIRPASERARHDRFSLPYITSLQSKIRVRSRKDRSDSESQQVNGRVSCRIRGSDRPVRPPADVSWRIRADR